MEYYKVIDMKDIFGECSSLKKYPEMKKIEKKKEKES